MTQNHKEICTFEEFLAIFNRLKFVVSTDDL